MSVKKRDEDIDFSESDDQSALKKNVQATQKDLDEAKEATKDISQSLNFGKISDIAYLYDIFSPTYDNVKSLDYLKKTRDSLLEQGYPETPALNEYLFWTTVSRRLQILYNTSHKQLLSNSDPNTTATELADIKFLEEIQKVTSHINNLQKTIDNSLAMTKKVRDVVDLHRETCEKAEKYLRSHFGEYVKKNSLSGKITDITDKAYWAFAQQIIQTDLGVEKIPFVWSEELRFLIERDLMPLEHMAFALRTSIEGIHYVAKIRGEKMPDIDLEEAENKLKTLMLEFETLRDMKDRELLEQ